jgi:DNA-binding transcriptional regulator/RsmH inhibitor MraZ
MVMPIGESKPDRCFCHHEYVVTVDGGPRLRLPRAIVRVLQKHGVTQLWSYMDPTGPRLILCPNEHKDEYEKLAQACFPAGMDSEYAYRRFICSSRRTEVSEQLRIGLTASYVKALRVKEHDTVVIVGIGPRYEIWRQDDWDNCETV